MKTKIITLSKKYSLVILIILTNTIVAQSRNQEVQNLNHLVGLLNNANNINVGFSDYSIKIVNYLDDKQHTSENLAILKACNAKNYMEVFNHDPFNTSEHQEREGIRSEKRTIAVEQKEAQEKNSLVEATAYVYLKHRNAIKKNLIENKIQYSSQINNLLNNFNNSVSSLIDEFTKLAELVQKDELKNENNIENNVIINKINIIQKKYYDNHLALYSKLKQEYQKYLPKEEEGQKKLRASLNRLDTSLKMQEAIINNFLNKKPNDFDTQAAEIKNDSIKAMHQLDEYFTDTYAYKHPLFEKGFHVNQIAPFQWYTYFYESNIKLLKWIEVVIKQKNNTKQAKDSLYEYNSVLKNYNELIYDYNYIVAFCSQKWFYKSLNTLIDLYDEKAFTELPPDTNTVLVLNKIYLPHISIFSLSNDQENKIELVTQTEDQNRINKSLPHHLVYLLDTSNSMNVGDKMELVKTNAKYLVAIQRESDKISLLTFADKTKVLLENKSCNLKNQISDIIDDLKAKGGTNINQGIEQAIEIATNNKLKEGKNKILLFTDGSFSVSINSEKLLLALQEKQINFSIVYLGETLYKGNEKTFELLCERTKIKFYDINKTDLKEILIKEATE